MKKDLLFRSTLLVLLVFLSFAGLYFAKSFLIPVIISGLLAMVLLPLARRLERWGVPRVLATVLSLLTVIAMIIAVIFVFYAQVASFASDIPTFKVKISEKFEDARILVETKTHIPARQQMNWIKKRYDDLLSSSGEYISIVLMGISGALATFSIIAVYVLFFLLYRERIYNFIMKLVSEVNHEKVSSIVGKVTDLVQHYLIGLLLELAVLGTLNTLGLLIIGIRQAVFFGYLAGLLNVIPYIGSLIGSLLPILMALVFKESFSAAIAVAAVMMANQFIDNNFLTPKIIGSHVRLNPLVTIMAIIAGGLLWGVAGMILFIPLLGVLKIICDNVTDLQPFGYLMGDDEDSGKNTSFLDFFRKLFSKSKP